MPIASPISDTAEPSHLQATAQLLPQLYHELRRLAQEKLSHEAPGQTLSATALVHEAYLRLVGPCDVESWEGRRHFFAAAAEAMRRILIDRARHKKSLKEGGGRLRLELATLDAPIDTPSADLMALDEALAKLEQKDKLKADLVKLRFFAGLTNKQAAETLGISTSTADNYWAYARSWLRVEIEKEANSLPPK